MHKKLPLQQQSLVIRAKSNNTPLIYKVGVTTISPDKYRNSPSLKALQNACVVYQPEISSTDTTIALRQAEGPIQSLIALPIGGDKREPIAILYVVSDQKNAFSQTDQRVLRAIGKIVEEVIRMYYTRQSLIDDLSRLLEEPCDESPPF